MPFIGQTVQPLLIRAGYPKLMTEVQELKKYELMVIFSGDLPEQDFERELEKARKNLGEYIKNIDNEDIWGRKEFMYRIKKQKRGYYVVFNFRAEATAIRELCTSVKLNPYVLRHLLITLPEDYEFGKYKTQILRMDRDDKKVPAKPPAVKAEIKAEPVPAEGAKAKIAGKEEEQELENVEKKLEKILENPDIDIK